MLESESKCLLKLIKGRRTIRCEFFPRRISKTDLFFILEAARWAPSGHNLQPWEFIAIQNDQVKRQLAESTMKVIEELLEDPRKLERTFARYHKWFFKDKEEAIAQGIGLYTKKATPYLKSKITSIEFEKLRTSGKKYCERMMASPLLLVTLLDRKKIPPNISSGLISLISVGASIQNIRLASISKGIGCHDLARPIDTVKGKKRLKEILNIPVDYDIVSVMRLGYINPEIENIYDSSFRVKLEKIIHYDSFMKKKEE